MSKITEKYLAEARRAGGGISKQEREWQGILDFEKPSNKLFIKWMKAAADNIEDCMQLAKKEKRGEYSRLRGIYSDMAKLLSDITK